MSQPRMMEIVTPLEADELLFHRLTGWEAMSRGFEYRVDLLSTKADIQSDEVLGQNVTIKLVLRHEDVRYFNGFVTRFSHGGALGPFYRYTAVVRPWLWFLTRTADCRIFQEMTVPDIIKQVFADHGASDYKFELTGTYRKWVYCVQYRETDFNFVSRLMEEEGIGYYYRHTEGHNTLVLTDSSSKHKKVPGCESLPIPEPGKEVRPDFEHISQWDKTQEIQPGVYVHDDYNFELPSTELKTTKTLPRKYKPSDYEVYDYPGHYMVKGDGEQYSSVRINEFGTQFETAFAATNARGLTVGALLGLEDHPRGEENVDHLVVGANYELLFEDYDALPNAKGTIYNCTFTAIPAAQPFRPARVTPKPFVQGPQTAVVTGPAGEEIHTDQYGRVKVQFHWDRLGKKDENTSCWIRVSSPWAGKAWGGIAIPRIGQEVVVDFLEGDPDQPLITGRVYNAEQMPPYGLPANKTQSGMKSRSSPGGGADNFNEIRFEDLKGSEQLFIHAEKNQDIEVENDETHWVGHDRTKTIDNDETTHVKHDRTETVDNNETITVHGARTETVDKDETITIHANRTETVDKNETITISGNRSITVSKSETATVALQRTHTVGVNETITVGAAQEVTVGGVQAITVGAQQSTTVGGGQSISVGGSRAIKAGGSQAVTIGQALTTIVGKDEDRKVKGDRSTTVEKSDLLKITKNLTIDVGEAIVIKTGDASISMKKDGTIVLKGKDITVQGSGKINIKADGDIVMKGAKIKEN